MPELDNVIANLELMPQRMNAGKQGKIGERQRALAKKLVEAGLLSKKGLKAVQARQWICPRLARARRQTGYWERERIKGRRHGKYPLHGRPGMPEEKYRIARQSAYSSRVLPEIRGATLRQTHCLQS